MENLQAHLEYQIVDKISELIKLNLLFYNLIQKLVNKTWTNQTSNMTYYDGSTSFQIVFDSSGRKDIEASIPFTTIITKDYVDIRYG